MAKQLLSNGKQIDHDLAAAIVAQVYEQFMAKLEAARAAEDEDLKQAYAYIVNAIYQRAIDAHEISNWPEYAKAIGIEFA